MCVCVCVCVYVFVCVNLPVCKCVCKVVACGKYQHCPQVPTVLERVIRFLCENVLDDRIHSTLTHQLAFNHYNRRLANIGRHINLNDPTLMINVASSCLQSLSLTISR